MNESPRSTPGRSARGKKSTESCTYMNYVSGGFEEGLRLGLCLETIIFRRIRRGRQYVFEGFNKGITCYGDGHKCLYFPVCIYPHLHLCKFRQACSFLCLDLSVFLFLRIRTAPVSIPHSCTPVCVPQSPKLSCYKFFPVHLFPSLL